MTSIGRRIRRERREREWSQKFLGKLIGVSRQTICSYEVAGSHPNKHHLERLETLFQINLEGDNNGETGTVSAEIASREQGQKEQ